MSEKGIRILWVDDEIEYLRSLIRYVEEKGYEVTGINNGLDAIDLVRKQYFDVVLLDEQMPGMSGLEVLESIKSIYSWLPVVMITKSEAEDLMEEAIGAKIADYLIKPVKPQQLLLSLKKTTEKRKITAEHTAQKYRQDFSRLSQQIMSVGSFEEWTEIYRRLIHWELEFEDAQDSGLIQILSDQFREANAAFARFIMKNYPAWIRDRSRAPLLSDRVLQNWFFPDLSEDRTKCLLVIDNLRFDQWKVLFQQISEYYILEQENIFCSILPTVTQYARNALFSGLMPLEIHKRFPGYWLFDEEEGGKNRFESELLRANLDRSGIDRKFVYKKIRNQSEGRKTLDEMPNLASSGLIILVYNFVDILSHARTEMNMIKELTKDAKAFRALTLSWFKNSYLIDTLRWLADKNIDLYITTDHGSVEVDTPVKVIGDRESTTNIRYKLGKNLNFDEREVFAASRPEDFMLPKNHVTSRYIFAREKQFFVYPKNYNQYVRHFKGTFQHGGISLEEMLVPFAKLKPKR